MHIIGIDFSTRYPGICISDGFKSFDFISIVNTHMSGANREFLESSEGRVSNFFFNQLDHIKTRDSKYYYENERSKIINYRALIQKVISEIIKSVGSHNVIVSIEGLSYGSKGSSAFDLAMAAGNLRDKLFVDILKGDINRFFVFAPSELKKNFGCSGTANKVEIFKKFLEDPGIDDVKSTPFFKFLFENYSHPYVYHKDVVKHPWEDLIDAYLCVYSIYQLVNDDKRDI